jgi:hypothetical protein
MALESVREGGFTYSGSRVRSERCNLAITKREHWDTDRVVSGDAWYGTSVSQ